MVFQLTNNGKIRSITMNVKFIPTRKPVNVIVNGWCNHEDTQIVAVDKGHYSPVQGDWVDDWVNIELCKCGAWRGMMDVMGDYWNDEGNEYEKEEQATSKSITFWEGLDA